MLRFEKKDNKWLREKKLAQSAFRLIGRAMGGTVGRTHILLENISGQMGMPNWAYGSSG